MEACCRLTLFRDLASLSSLQQRLRTFSSLSSPAVASPRKREFFSDDSAEGGSAVYRHTLKFQRPSNIKWREQLRNSVSLIGTIGCPLKQINSVSDFGVYTSLKVKTSPNSNRSFWILLKMWHEMAEISIKHLKPNDCIYVSGRLGLYTKADESGKLKTYYEVIVKEINYVAQCGHDPTFNNSKQSDSGGGETGLEKYKKRLHLWQVFFANPSEWMDFRGRKVNPNQPDFKHKDTSEALWINSRDPPWVKQQLQLHDSRLATQGQREDVSSGSCLSPWVYDDK